MNGQAIKRDEADNNSSAGDPHEIWYRFGGRQRGFVGNNGEPDAVPTTSGTGAFLNGSNVHKSFADFDLSLDGIGINFQGSAAASYTVAAGDTVSSIAAALWGDASLWYKIAEVNGLTGESVLIEGMTLIIPAGVMKAGHNASTFAPYDPAEVIGPASPTAPKPPKNKKHFGGLGAILLAVIAIAVFVTSRDF
jgi:hypothetical protein